MKKNLKKVALLMGIGLILTGVTGQESASAYTGGTRGIVAENNGIEKQYAGMPRGLKNKIDIKYMTGGTRGIVANKEVDKQYYTGMPRGTKENDMTGYPRG